MRNLSLVLLMSGTTAVAQITTLQPQWWITDGNVNAIAADPLTGQVAIGGAFTYAGPNNPHGAEINLVTGRVRLDMPRINGIVQAAASDGSGGWYIGGSFTVVGGQPRARLAHILADGSVSPWAPTANNTVFAMVVHGSWLYIGGGFGQINGTPRARIAQIDLNTGALGTWGSAQTVAPPTVVLCMAAVGTRMFLGGSISALTISAVPYTRNNLMAVDINTGAMDPWAPAASHPVGRMIATPTEVYVSGDFTSLNGTARNYCGALDISTGALLPWDPNPNLSVSKTVSTMALHTDRMFLGGSFTSLGASPVNRLAAVDLITGVIHSDLLPSPDGSVTALTVDPSSPTVFAAGSFMTIGGQDRRCFAAVDITSGAVTALAIRHSVGSLTLVSTGTALFNGGSFLSSGGVSVINMVVLDSTGRPISVQPDVAFNGSITAIERAQGNWYVGGNFSAPAAHLLAIDQTTGTMTAWNPAANGTVHALLADGTSIYAAGDFSSIGGQPRSGLAELSLLSNTNNATSWHPSPDGVVNALQLDASNVYAGGTFNNIGGAAHRGVAAVDRAGGLAHPIAYDLNLTGICNALVLDGSDLYIAGDFTTINGSGAPRLGVVDRSTGTLAGNFASFSANGGLRSMALEGSLLFLSGSFNTMNGQPRNSMAAIDPSTGALNGFDPALTGGTSTTVYGADRHLYIGGTFTGFAGGLGRSHAVYVACTGSVWYADADEDGHGDAGSMVFACDGPPGTVAVSDDCDDADPLRYPGAPCDDADPYTGLDVLDANCDCAGQSHQLQVRAFLNGPYNAITGLMRDDLRSLAGFPLTEPYTSLGYTNHAPGGGEQIDPSVLAVTGNNAIVDWVFLQIRSASEPNQVLATRSCLLQRAGDIVDVDGFSPVRLYLPSGQYHVALRHRNHLGVMTATPPTFTLGSPVVVQFDLPATATHGANAQRLVSGVNTFWSGDVTGNGQVKYAGGSNDRDPILVAIGGTVPTAMVAGYFGLDCNLDGLAKYAGGNNDRDQILQTVGGAVPTAVRNAQLP